MGGLHSALIPRTGPGPYAPRPAFLPPEPPTYRPDRLLPLSRLPTDKLLGRHSRLLVGGQIVAKHFPVNEVESYAAEVNNLQRVDGCRFVPRLFAADGKKRIIYIIYVGEPPLSYTPELRKDVTDKLRILRKRYRLARSFSQLNGLPKVSDVAIDRQGAVFLVNLGPAWRVE